MRLSGGSGVWVLICVELACGAARQPGSNSAGSAGQTTIGAEVSGVVVDDEEHWPLSGRVVEIANQRVVTDEQGRFHIPHAPAVYDARISEADGSWVTLYRSVAQRHPLLGQHVENRMGPREHAAHVKVVLKSAGVSSPKTAKPTFFPGPRTQVRHPERPG